jgi:hypothetical protein
MKEMKRHYHPLVGWNTSCRPRLENQMSTDQWGWCIFSRNSVLNLNIEIK